MIFSNPQVSLWPSALEDFAPKHLEYLLNAKDGILDSMGDKKADAKVKLFCQSPISSSSILITFLVPFILIPSSHPPPPPPPFLISPSLITFVHPFLYHFAFLLPLQSSFDLAQMGGAKQIFYTPSGSDGFASFLEEPQARCKIRGPKLIFYKLNFTWLWIMLLTGATGSGTSRA